MTELQNIKEEENNPLEPINIPANDNSAKNIGDTTEVPPSEKKEEENINKLLEQIIFANSILGAVASIIGIDFGPKDVSALIKGINYGRVANDN